MAVSEREKEREREWEGEKKEKERKGVEKEGGQITAYNINAAKQKGEWRVYSEICTTFHVFSQYRRQGTRSTHLHSRLPFLSS